MKIKKRFCSKILCAALVLVLAAGLMPGKAQAAGNYEQLGLFFATNYILAKGNAITLENGGDGYTKIKVGSSYVDFSLLKSSIGAMYPVKDGDSTAAQLSGVDIYGGWNDGGSGNTSITINGGNVAKVYGGSSGSENMSGNASIVMNGGRAQQLIASGYSGTVTNSTITVTGGTVSVRIELAGRDGVTGDSTLVLTGGSVKSIYNNYTGSGSVKGDMSIFNTGIGELMMGTSLIDNYVMLDGSKWTIKGNTAKAMNGNYLTVNNDRP